MPEAIELLFKLILGHFVADILLQPNEMAKAKNPHASPPAAYNPKVHGPLLKTWPYYMAGHSSVHAVAVLLITDSPLLALLEFVSHYIIDTTKSYFKLSIHLDQFLHILSKVVWAVLWICFI